MWQNFYTPSNNIVSILTSMENVKKNIFEIESIKIKECFAKKVVGSFDNLMIFFSDNGIALNLQKALAESQEDMRASQMLFPDIKMYLIAEDNGYSLMIKNLEYSDVIIGLLDSLGFKYMGQEDSNIENMPMFEFNALSQLAFSFSLVNYSRSWINFTPTIEERAHQQAEIILLRMTFKKIESSLMERMQFLENIKKHPNYKELYNKIMRLMPKLESSLEKQFRVSSVVMNIPGNKRN